MRRFLTIFTVAALLATVISCSGNQGRIDHDDDDDDDRTEAKANRAHEDADEPRLEADGEAQADLPSNYYVIDADHKVPLASAADVIVFDFNASWCGPCKLFHPAFVAAARRFPNVNFCSIDIDDNPDLAEIAGIEAVPTVVVLVVGKGVSKFVGTSDILPEDRFFGVVENACKGNVNVDENTVEDLAVYMSVYLNCLSEGDRS